MFAIICVLIWWEMFMSSFTMRTQQNELLKLLLDVFMEEKLLWQNIPLLLILGKLVAGNMKKMSAFVVVPVTLCI